MNARRQLFRVIHSIAWRWPYLGVVLYRFVCPYPINERCYTISGCIAEGSCGCDNDPRNAKAGEAEAA